VSLKIGDPAPVVDVYAYVRDTDRPVPMEVGGVSESWTVLVFYARDFTFLSPAELRGFAELQAAFALEGASVIAASTDSWHVHRAWLETSAALGDIRYPVVADPTHELIQAYDVLDVDEGAARPVTYVIDPSGTVRDVAMASPGSRRSPERTLETLRELRLSELQAVA
jgi:alkyl hydroperoxide reductase subunit AhpC